jgi:hypothetical protein
MDHHSPAEQGSSSESSTDHGEVLTPLSTTPSTSKLELDSTANDDTKMDLDASGSASAVRIQSVLTILRFAHDAVPGQVDSKPASVKGKGKAEQELDDELAAEEAHIGKEEDGLDETEEILIATIPKANIVGLPHYRGIHTCASASFLFLLAPRCCLISRD